MLNARLRSGRRCNGDYFDPLLETGPARAFDIDFLRLSVLPGVRESADDESTAGFFLTSHTLQPRLVLTPAAPDSAAPWLFVPLLADVAPAPGPLQGALSLGQFKTRVAITHNT